MKITRMTLRYQDGRSDKHYTVYRSSAWALINWGRWNTRGQVMATTRETADRRIDEKLAKGYQVVSSDACDVDIADAPLAVAHFDRIARAVPDTGQTEPKQASRPRKSQPPQTRTRPPVTAAKAVERVVPMLAESIDPSELTRYVADDLWWMSQKVDGVRTVIICDGGAPVLLNRNGMPLSKKAPKALAQLHLPKRFVLDGEILDDTVWLFDLIEADGLVAPSLPYQVRHAALTTLADKYVLPGCRVLPVAKTPQEKLALVESALGDGKEGVMLRYSVGPYEHGRRSRHLLKAKFVKTVDCVVTEVSRNGKESAGVGLYRDGQLTEVGAVSLIGRPSVSVGDVLEVRYLYAVDPARPRLTQPVLVRVRDDKAAAECTLDQLQYTNKNVAAD